MSAPLIYLIAGEPSGDALGAGLMRALKLAQPDIKFAGIGGDAMQHEGLSSLFSYRELSIMGFLEIVPHISKLLQRIQETAQDIAKKQPAAVVTIDSPGFNFRLAKVLRDALATKTIKRIHYVAPSVWAYKPRRAAKTAKLYDLLLTLLPFEPPYFEKEGLKTVFVGHPVLWQNWNGDSVAFRKLHGIAADASILLILPGSRAGEIKKHLSVFLESAQALPDYVPVILAGALVQDHVRELVPEGTIIADISEKKDAFAAASLALSKSGTITLELAAAGVPMVVAHRVNPFTAWLVRRMIKIPHASLVNIAAKKEIVPEYIQERCAPEYLSKALKTLAMTDTKSMQRKACSEAIQLLRADNKTAPDILAARAVLEVIKGEKHDA
jgi:lipid-A-disaccharide synthase